MTVGLVTVRISLASPLARVHRVAQKRAASSVSAVSEGRATVTQKIRAVPIQLSHTPFVSRVHVTAVLSLSSSTFALSFSSSLSSARSLSGSVSLRPSAPSPPPLGSMSFNGSSSPRLHSPASHRTGRFTDDDHRGAVACAR